MDKHKLSTSELIRRCKVVASDPSIPAAALPIACAVAWAPLHMSAPTIGSGVATFDRQIPLGDSKRTSQAVAWNQPCREVMCCV